MDYFCLLCWWVRKHFSLNSVLVPRCRLLFLFVINIAVICGSDLKKVWTEKYFGNSVSVRCLLIALACPVLPQWTLTLRTICLQNIPQQHSLKLNIPQQHSLKQNIPQQHSLKVTKIKTTDFSVKNFSKINLVKQNSPFHREIFTILIPIGSHSR